MAGGGDGGIGLATGDAGGAEELNSVTDDARSAAGETGGKRVSPGDDIGLAVRTFGGDAEFAGDSSTGTRFSLAAERTAELRRAQREIVRRTRGNCEANSDFIPNSAGGDFGVCDGCGQKERGRPRRAWIGAAGECDGKQCRSQPEDESVGES